jgi:hypothetical protein
MTESSGELDALLDLDRAAADPDTSNAAFLTARSAAAARIAQSRIIGYSIATELLGEDDTGEPPSDSSLTDET